MEQLNPEIPNFNSEGIFRNSLLKSIRPVSSKTYSINDTIGLKVTNESPRRFQLLAKR